MMWNPNHNAFDPRHMAGVSLEGPPTGCPEWQAIQLIYRCDRMAERLRENSVQAERDGDEQGAWLGMATGKENARFKARLLRDLGLMWAGRLQRSRGAAKALLSLANAGVWGVAIPAGQDGTMMEAANRFADPLKPTFDILLQAGLRVNIRAYPKTRHLRLHVDGCAFPQDWHTRGLASTKHEASNQANPPAHGVQPEG